MFLAWGLSAEWHAPDMAQLLVHIIIALVGCACLFEMGPGQFCYPILLRSTETSDISIGGVN